MKRPNTHVAMQLLMVGLKFIYVDDPFLRKAPLIWEATCWALLDGENYKYIKDKGKTEGNHVLRLINIA